MTDENDPLTAFMRAAVSVAPGAEPTLLPVICRMFDARAARLYVADYALRRLQQIGLDGPEGPPVPIAGTVAGHAFLAGGPVVVTESSSTIVRVPLVEGTERIGLLELESDTWGGTLPAGFEAVVAVLVLTLVTKGRYSDHWVRARRSLALSPAAEIQWNLLPPLSCSTERVGVGGILEPAYNIGGDSFDYALNGNHLEFAIVDAVGHGTNAVLMAAAAINSLRNSRRSGAGLESAFHTATELIATQFGRSRYVTAQIASLDLTTGLLTWINAGHVLPMLVRNGTYAGELTCTPSRPLGLGGPLEQVATERLQRGDRVLFFTDGITEAQASNGSRFGPTRLADFLVRAALEGVPVADTARRLSSQVLEYVNAGLQDDATLLLVEYRG